MAKDAEHDRHPLPPSPMNRFYACCGFAYIACPLNSFSELSIWPRRNSLNGLCFENRSDTL
eukprot:5324367-Amphidinium_carterae.1